MLNYIPFEGTPTGSIPGDTFVCSVTPVQLSVVVNGVTLIPSVGYTLSGATITLTTALEAGDSIYTYGLFL